MHATVIHATIHDRAEAKRGLEEIVVPLMRQAPGFVSAVYVAVDDTHGMSIEVFETEEQARAAAPPPDVTTPGVSLDRIEVGEVVASA